MSVLLKLSEFFPTSVYTGLKLVMLSPDHEVVITHEINRTEFRTKENSTRVAVEIYVITNGIEKQLIQREIFQIEDIRILAGEIEKYIESALNLSIKSRSNTANE